MDVEQNASPLSERLVRPVFWLAFCIAADVLSAGESRYAVDWVWAFLFTQAVEIPIYMRGLRVKPYEAFGASAFTHPIVWFLIPSLFTFCYSSLHSIFPSFQLASVPRYWVMVVFAEMFAVVAEALYFRFIGKQKTWIWSFVANMASVSLGLASRALWGWP